MKKIILSFVTVFVCVSLFSQNISVIAEEQNYASDSLGLQPGGYLWVNKYFKNTGFGLFGYSFVQKGWYEIYGGPNYTFVSKKNPQRSLEVGIGFGHEKFFKETRKSVYAYYISIPDTTGKDLTGRFQFLGILEKGGSGYWELIYAAYNIVDNFSLGVQYQKWTGVIGARFGINYKNFEVYFNPGYNPTYKETACLFGINFSADIGVK